MFLCDSRGHEAYLRTGPQYDFDHYKQLVHEITQAFNGISKEVLEIKGKLHHDFDRPDLSEHIEKLQSKEKEKLELVSALLNISGCVNNTRQLLLELLHRSSIMSHLIHAFIGFFYTK